MNWCYITSSVWFWFPSYFCFCQNIPDRYFILLLLHLLPSGLGYLRGNLFFNCLMERVGIILVGPDKTRPDHSIEAEIWVIREMSGAVVWSSVEQLYWDLTARRTMLGVVEVGGTPGTSWGVITGTSRDRPGLGKIFEICHKAPSYQSGQLCVGKPNYTGGFSLQSLPVHQIHSQYRRVGLVRARPKLVIIQPNICWVLSVVQCLYWQC